MLEAPAKNSNFYSLQRQSLVHAAAALAKYHAHTLRNPLRQVHSQREVVTTVGVIATACSSCSIFRTVTIRASMTTVATSQGQSLI